MIYENELQNLYSTIELLLAETKKYNIELSVVKDNFTTLLHFLEEYEFLQTIVLTLNPSSSIAQKIPSSTKIEIQNSYIEQLVKANNEIAIRIDNLQNQLDKGVISEKGKKILKAYKDLISENNIIISEIYASRTLDYESLPEEIYQSFTKTAEGIHFALGKTGLESDTSAVSLITRIESNRRQIKDIKDSVNTHINKLHDEYLAECDTIAQIIDSRPYADHETVNGKVTELAIAERRKLKEQQNQLIIPPYKEKATVVYKSAFEEMSKLTDYALAYIDILNTETYKVDSTSPDVSAIIDANSISAEAFSGIANITIGNKTSTLYFKIPYVNWLEENAPSKEKTLIEYNEYLDRAAMWYEVLKEYPSLFKIEFGYKIKCDQSSTYKVHFTYFSIYKEDRLVYTQKIKQTDSIKYNSINIGELSVADTELLDNNPLPYIRTNINLAGVKGSSIDLELNKIENNSKQSITNQYVAKIEKSHIDEEKTVEENKEVVKKKKEEKINYFKLSYLDGFHFAVNVSPMWDIDFSNPVPEQLSVSTDLMTQIGPGNLIFEIGCLVPINNNELDEISFGLGYDIPFIFSNLIGVHIGMQGVSGTTFNFFKDDSNNNSESVSTKDNFYIGLKTNAGFLINLQRVALNLDIGLSYLTKTNFENPMFSIAATAGIVFLGF